MSSTEPQQQPNSRAPNGTRFPDPSILTTEQLIREISNERAWTEGQLDVLRERLRGIDTATDLRLGAIRDIPNQIDERIDWLSKMMVERFESIALQFKERDTRSERESRDNKVAVDAAFAAQKEAACLECHEVVLCADLVWRSAGELKVGDELVALDDEVSGHAPGRRYRKATVTANSLREDELLQVNTSAGPVRCNGEHPFLVGGGSGHPWHWVSARDLRPGTKLARLMPVWEVDDSYEAGWLAGFLDGEGCLGFKSRRNGAAKLSVGQVEGPLADKFDKVLAATGVAVVEHTRDAQPHFSNGWRSEAQAQRRWDVNGRSDIMQLLGSVRPSRLLAKSEQVWDGFAIRGHNRSRTTVLSVEVVGTGTIAALSTSTKTYIGAGFAMHNSEQNKSNTLAISKSEAATAETIKTFAELFRTTTGALSDKIDDLKERASRTEAIKQGAAEFKGEARAGIGSATQIIGAIIAVLAIVITLYATRSHTSTPTPQVVTVTTPSTTP